MAGDWDHSAGLMWMGGRTVPWTCAANVHVYSLQLAPAFWTGPWQTSLKWVKYPLGPAGLWLHVQLRSDDPRAVFDEVEIGGRHYAVAGASRSGVAGPEQSSSEHWMIHH